ncbi:cellular morphogenesis regulator dopa [Mytilinidion resinicola]|uniref:Cellular morphogenesis regulator dopa n=1 Tax=Mytilinidion resinicola TaxID=574789 RepID=A0A6A6Z2L3_9PEZI|nr:cellular morphogenesis regulator dopa [Mytilinidion resinicola]KAF2815048.1 cellular morphogenesis regulator dopa [Mytilinidion resinicola]
MSLDPASNLQTHSPTSSGRSSPAPRTPRRTIEDAHYKKDKSFRRYASGVERALSLFDTAQQEWADYISFLGRLLKAIQAHPVDVPVIAHSSTVATRLAQCLNPTLPSGVHQKALEVYSYIFKIIGKDALNRDLYLYLPGLVSVLSFASLSVRPFFLSLIETYVLRLDSWALRPALKAIILGLLPGLEEETSEDFERMVQALDKLREAVTVPAASEEESKSEAGSSHYWQCFFLAAITNPSRRQGALAFLVRRLPKFGSRNRRGSVPTDASTALEGLPKEAEAAISPEPGLLVRCFAAGLSDPQLLIQRGFLDLLVSHLPLDSPVLQQRINQDDLDRLVTAAAGVVSRRDMSLNRRLWAWFLGPEPSAGPDGTEPLASPTQETKNLGVDSSAHHAVYFSQYGLQSLTRSLMKMINRPSLLVADRARPFRICLSLMDRWEVGGLVVPEIFLPALQSVQSYSETADREQLDEVMKSASVFFDGVESGLIWGKLVELVVTALNSDASSHDKAAGQLKLAKFVMTRFNVRDEEMLLHHMPLMVLTILVNLNNHTKRVAQSAATAVSVTLALETADILVQLLPERALRTSDSSLTAHKSGTSSKVKSSEIVTKITGFYLEAHGTLEYLEPPFEVPVLGQLCLREAGSLFTSSLGHKSPRNMAEVSSRILSSVIYKVQDLHALHDVELLTILQQVLVPTSPSKQAPTIPFHHIASITAVLSALQSSRTPELYIAASQLPDLMHPLVACAWEYLSPYMPKYHVEAVRCLWQLHSISPSNRFVEAAITSIISQTPSTESAAMPDVGRRFALLWTHTMNDQISHTGKRSFSSPERFSSLPTTGQTTTPTAGFQVVLTRPLFLMLDALTDEGTELFAFVKSWLQDLPTLNKVFWLLATHLQSLQCLKDRKALAPGQAGNSKPLAAPVDDSKECLYYLRHVLNILRWPTNYTWLTLAEEPAPQSPYDPPGAERETMQVWIVRTCMKALSMNAQGVSAEERPHYDELYRTAVSIVIQIYHSPYSVSLKDLELETPLMARLRISCPSLQSLLLEAILAALKLRLSSPPQPERPQRAASRLSMVLERPKAEEPESPPVAPPPELVECLRDGFSSPSSRLDLDDWVTFLAEVLPLFADTIFQNLLPLVECFCTQINQVFGQLRSTFNEPLGNTQTSPESTLVSLMNGLEQILAKAHDRLVMQETRTTTTKSPEQPQGFFGNMVSGLISTESNQTRNPTANSRLTVLLCFQDTVRMCFSIWSWGGYGSSEGRQDPTSLASFGYTSLRMRNRSRRILEHLFAAEALECLETLAVLWCKSARGGFQATSVMSLLNVLNGSKPKHTIPAIFNAVYSRTNPNALDPLRMSTLTSDLADTDLVTFLVDYTKSLEDDAMDEIWPDCIIFLRDVLANPLPHRQILPTLVEFTAVLGQKVDNTNFGEQRKMRRELGDLFTRLLTAVFTTRSMGFLQEPSQVAAVEKASSATNSGSSLKRSVDVVTILTSVIPDLPLILVESDRVANAATSISTNIIGPTFRAKAFPENVSKPILDLLYQLTRVAQSNKTWKKDIADAFNDARFFATPLPLITSSWLPILAQWTLTDKDRLLELLSRLSAPTTAGIMFGVGAASARQEADRKTQLTLRRISLLLLAGPPDTFTPSLPAVSEKIVELLAATPASSPSSTTRTELFMLLRALVLQTDPVHLAPLWPLLNAELAAALSSLLPDAANKDTYNNAALLQACKLLDALVVLLPDDFQCNEWVFVADTIDAVYRPADWHPSALADEIAEVLAAAETPTSRAAHHHPPAFPAVNRGTTAKRTPWLDPLIAAVQGSEEGADVRAMARSELVSRVLRPFLGQLGLVAFEATYGMGEADVEGVRVGLLADLCED